MLQKFIHWFASIDPQEPHLLDHLPIGPAEPNPALARKLKEAAAKHGRPFKCAASGLPREHFVTPTTIREVDAPKAPVITLTSRARR